MEIVHALTLFTSALVSNCFLFFFSLSFVANRLMKSYVYSYGRVKISNLLNICLQEFRDLIYIMCVTLFFCNENIFALEPSDRDGSSSLNYYHFESHGVLVFCLFYTFSIYHNVYWNLC